MIVVVYLMLNGKRLRKNILVFFNIKGKGEKRMSKNKQYGVGLILFLFGSAGMAENITSGRGSFIFCAIFFSIGLALILDSYVHKK